MITKRSAFEIIGEPPGYFDEVQRGIWVEVGKLLTAEVLLPPARLWMEFICGQLSKLRREGLQAEELSMLTIWLDDIGLDPTEKRRLLLSGRSTTPPMAQGTSSAPEEQGRRRCHGKGSSSVN